MAAPIGPSQDDRNNFQVRMGGAYQITDKTVLRAGYGKYFLNAGTKCESSAPIRTHEICAHLARSVLMPRNPMLSGFALATMVIIMVPVASSTDPSSRELALTLTGLLDQHRLDAIATRDPQRSDHFIAAVYSPGTQLLVVRGFYAAPELLAQRIGQRRYHEAYADIQAASPASGRRFVVDHQADGLYQLVDRDECFDTVYRNGTDQVIYNGHWEMQQLTRSAYLERFAVDEVEYARLLGALMAALSGPARAFGELQLNAASGTTCPFVTDVRRRPCDPE